jgi:hypothetical protein
MKWKINFVLKQPNKTNTPMNTTIVVDDKTTMVFNKPIETTQRLGQSNGATVNHASDARRAQGERQWCVTGMFWAGRRLSASW